MTAILGRSQFTGLTEGYAASQGSTLDTGDLRRAYGLPFGSFRVSKLNVARDPFFRWLNLFRRNPVDESQFKFLEERPSFHKRYAYVVAHGTTSAVSTSNDATVTATNIAQGDVYYVKMKTDYKSAGNIGSRFGNSSNAVAIGATGTKPQFFVVGLLVKINFGAAYNQPSDFIVGKIEEITDSPSDESVILKLLIVRTLKTATNNELQWLSATAPMANVYSVPNAYSSDNLESKRSYISGNAFGRGSGFPDTWHDNPYSSGYAQTQIWKTVLGMDNTTRATVFKYAPNEWARIWGNKLLEHKWDISEDFLWGTQYTDADGVQYTQGAADYILNYGTTFSLNHATKNVDDFLNDMSQLVDPRYGSSNGLAYFCDTFTYNWLNKASGYFNNSIQISPNFRADFAAVGQRKIGAVEVNIISTIYGDMKVVRDVHLDGSGISILAVSMNNVEYRPLIGNGLNRDTTIFPGVQTLENSGVDSRVDLIQTEAALQFTGPENHAVWVTSY